MTPPCSLLPIEMSDEHGLNIKLFSREVVIAI
jgi:hypothetical protein